MVNKAQLLKRLEKHIEDLGREYSRMALDFFWMEEDIRGWLFAQLSQDPVFTYSIGDSSVPIVHAQYRTRSASPQFYDLAVVESDDAKRIAEWKKGKSQNRFEEKDAKLLAAVEIEFLYRGGTAWQGKLEGNVNKLIKNKDQFTQGYLLVFVLTEFRQNKKYDYSQVKAYLKGGMVKWKGKVNLKIYCAAGPGSAAGNIWI
ncbi:MAG: hypothetical protein DDT29_00485 [Dehalococcoidia bacterium]|nr:hypothetical protein [Bacillota bacterium]